MAILTDSQIGDLITGSLDDLGRLKFNQIATTIQNYEVLGRILRKDRVGFGEGTGIQRSLMVKHSGNARMIGMYQTDTVNIQDVLQTISIDWRHTAVPYSYDRRELLMNRGFSKIVDILQLRRADAMISLAELMEDQFWQLPVDLDLDVYGIPYWVIYESSTGGTFTTNTNTAFSAGPGGLDPATYTRWANWTQQYTNVTKADAIAKMRTAIRKIRFQSPVDIPDFRRGRGDQYRIYVNEATLQDFEDLGEAQNENLGRDLAPMDGTMTFRRNPIVWVPWLDDNSVQTNPIYMLNFAYLQPVFLKGDYLRETEPDKAPGQHNTWEIWIDLTWNLLVTDRRCQAVLATD